MVETKHERFKFKNKQEFLKKIQELNLDIPFSDDIRILFDRTVIQEKTLPNRSAVHPMEGADGDAEGTPGDLTFRRYLRFAAGGTGLIWFEATANPLLPQPFSRPAAKPPRKSSSYQR
jgi:hypothetical protein